MRWGLKALLVLVLLGPGLPAKAQEPSPDIPALISADQITYDENLQVVTASGNVEIAQGDRVLLADSISYNLQTEVVTASGNITLMEPGGEIIFAEYVELSDNLREGFVRDVRLLLTDRSRLAAASGIRTGGNRSELRKAVFSPCRQCRNEEAETPLWQLKANRIIHDQEEQVIKYRDATFEVMGVPIAYTPYFEHPDPTVKRKSGFLAPTAGSSDNLGITAQLPYYWAISPDRDFTFEPIITSKQGPVLAGEYRQLLPDGRLKLAGSGTIADRESTEGRTKRDQLRGHIDSEGRFDINDTWRWGFNLQRASDDTYLRLYKFSSDRTLTSSAFVEGFRGRNYFAVNNYLYQGLRQEDDNDEAPIILPQLDFNFVGEPGVVGGKYVLDGNILALHRGEGRESRRISLRGGWELPYTSPIGDVYSLKTSLETDAYWVEGFEPNQQGVVNPRGPTKTRFTGRVFPQLALQWRYPWVSEIEGLRQVIEPIGQAVVAPSGSVNPGEIPNEDSQDLEFDDTNLFSLNRFPGIDRIDPGSRFDYGFKWDLVSEQGYRTNAFLGQSYRVSEDVNFQPGSGLEDNFSDFVGRISVNPSDYVDVLFRFRLDKNDLERKRSELDVSLGPPAFNLQVAYLDIVDDADEVEFSGREELKIRLKSRLNEFWSAFIAHRRDLLADDSLSTEVGVTYDCDCALIEVVAQRNFFSDREIDPEDSIFVRVILKYLGEFGTS